MVRLAIPRRTDFRHPGCDCTPDELEFALAVYAYQRTTGRRYPAWSEILYVLRTLGYAKGRPPPVPQPLPPDPHGPAFFRTTLPEEIESCS
jgi:hypothetical protein